MEIFQAITHENNNKKNKFNQQTKIKNLQNQVYNKQKKIYKLKCLTKNKKNLNKIPNKKVNLIIILNYLIYC